MKAAIYPGHGKPIVIETLPDPEPGPDDVILKVHRSGICGTDLAMTRGATWDYGPNKQFGHEFAGEIVALGKNVAGYKMGQKVSVVTSGACGHCEACAGGNHVLCRTGVGSMYGFSQFAPVPSKLLIKMPDTLSMADGALMEPLAIALYGVRQSRIQPGDRVLVLGGGTVALYTIYWARRLGAHRIAAISRSDRRKDLVLKMGADAFIKYGDNEVGEVVEALGGSPHIVFECVGNEGMLPKAAAHAALYGKIVSLGFCTSPDPIVPAISSFKCLTMQFLVGYTMRDFLYIADQMDKGHADPKAIVTNDIPLTDMPAMMDRLRGPNNETKVHVHPSGF